MKKFEQLNRLNEQLESLRSVCANVIEQGGSIEFEWTNTGVVENPFIDGCWKTFESNGSQTFEFRIPPHKIVKK